MVTSDEFVGWKASPNTKFFLQYLNDYREERKKELANGNALRHSADSTAMKYAEYVGVCSVIEDILNLEYSLISEFYKLEAERENDRINTP